MPRQSRRSFLKQTSATVAFASFVISGTKASGQVLGANDTVQMAVAGFRSMGSGHIGAYQKMSGVRVAALCDVDSKVLGRQIASFDKRGQKVGSFVDVRKMLEEKNIDAVTVATPNHWHALMTVWACQAGKDVCVEKPVSHNIWEGRKMVEAARKYNRIVQADLDCRSKENTLAAIRFVQQGRLGPILLVRGFVYKRRPSLGKVGSAQPIPASISYDLWSGPAPNGPLMRKNLHYDWHWVWETGCGELGNNGVHHLDLARLCLGQKGLPRRVMSIGGRFGYKDDGETPNSQIVLFDYQPAPIIFEVRGLPQRPGTEQMDAYRALSPRGPRLVSCEPSRSPNTGIVVECEGGWLDLDQPAAYDNRGKLIRDFGTDEGTNHLAHFVHAMRTRKREDVRTDILEGHLSTALCHMGNISHRIGQKVAQEKIQAVIASDKSSMETMQRMQAHLAVNGVDLKKTPAILGPWVEMAPDKEEFQGPLAAEANALLRRTYREPFVIRDEI